MKINMIHIKERSPSGEWLNCAVFDAHANDGNHAQLLSQLTQKVRTKGLPVDQSALAFISNGRVRFFGDRGLVSYLANGWLPDWTDTIDV